MNQDLMPLLRKCGVCRERRVSPRTLPSYEATLEHDGKKYEVILRDLPVQRCDHCGEVVLTDAAETRLSKALRSAAGLLAPDEIRGQREALQLTQKQLAAFLKISDSTLSRWETGFQIQQRCMDLLLRSFFAVPELRTFLGATEPNQASLAPIPFAKITRTPALRKSSST